MECDSQRDKAETGKPKHFWLSLLSHLATDTEPKGNVSAERRRASEGQTLERAMQVERQC